MSDVSTATGERDAGAHDMGFALRPAELFALIGYGAIAVVVLAVGAAPIPLRPDPPLVAHVSGLLAGYGVAVMLVLMSRTPVLERGVGADRLTRWHGVGGRAIFALTGAHALAATHAWVRASGRSTSEGHAGATPGCRSPPPPVARGGVRILTGERHNAPPNAPHQVVAVGFTAMTRSMMPHFRRSHACTSNPSPRSQSCGSRRR